MTNANEEVRDLIGRTRPIRELSDAVRSYPVELLATIVREYEREKQPVPDHRLGPSNYLTGIALRALTEAGLIGTESGGRHVIRMFVPTAKGIEYGRRLLAEREAVGHTGDAAGAA